MYFPAACNSITIPFYSTHRTQCTLIQVTCSSMLGQWGYGCRKRETECSKIIKCVLFQVTICGEVCTQLSLQYWFRTIVWGLFSFNKRAMLRFLRVQCLLCPYSANPKQRSRSLQPIGSKILLAQPLSWEVGLWAFLVYVIIILLWCVCMEQNLV